MIFAQKEKGDNLMEKGKRLIDANALKDRFKLRINWLEKDVHDQYSLGLFHGAEYDAKLVDEIPTVDAAEVVRCKDCKHCRMCYPEKQIGKEATPGWYCKEHKRYRRPDDFCSYGERREGE